MTLLNFDDPELCGALDNDDDVDDGMGEQLDASLLGPPIGFFEAESDKELPPDSDCEDGDIAEPSAGLVSPVKTQVGESSTHSASPGVSSSSTSPNSSSGSDLVQLPIKRRRLSSKTKVADEVLKTENSPLATSLSPSALAEHPCLKEFQLLSAKDQQKIKTLLRVRRHRVKEQLKRGVPVHLGGKLFSSVPDEDKERFDRELCVAYLHDVMLDTSQPNHLRGCAMQQSLSLEPMTEAAKFLEQKCLRSKSLMMTFNGKWGIVTLPGAEPSASRCVEQVLKEVKENAYVQGIRDEIHTKLELLRAKKCIQHYGASVELCDGTFKATGQVRVHVHVWIYRSVVPLETKLLTFRKSSAHVNQEAMQFFGMRGSRSQSAAYSGAFYVYVQKPGTIFTFTNLLPFSGYAVKDFWITSLYTAGKITASTAKELYIRAVVRCEVNLRQLNFCERAKLELELEKAQLALEVQQQSVQRAFRIIPAVQDWDKQYEPSAVPRTRHHFLVLNGVSGTGKTRFARSLASSPEKVWYCDMTSGVPDLRGFNRLQHELIILDEVQAGDAIKLKKLLQCSNDSCVLGVSPTMQHSYVVNCWGTKLVVCSNVWTASMQGLQPEDRDWLEANSVYVEVDTPLWI